MLVIPEPDKKSEETADFVHHLVIKLLEGGRGLLQAEPSRWEVGDVAIPWQIFRGNAHPEDAGWSPRWGHFRACLAAFGSFYLDRNPYGGFKAGLIGYRDHRYKICRLHVEQPLRDGGVLAAHVCQA